MTALLLIVGERVNRIANRTVTHKAEIEPCMPIQHLREQLEAFRLHGLEPEREPNGAACVHAWPEGDGQSVFGELAFQLRFYRYRHLEDDALKALWDADESVDISHGLVRAELNRRGLGEYCAV